MKSTQTFTILPVHTRPALTSYQGLGLSTNLAIVRGHISAT